MGDVLQFKFSTDQMKHLRQQVRLERELSLPFPSMAKSSGEDNRLAAPDGLSSRLTTVKSEPGFPLIGFAIIGGAILVYAFAALHLMGQPHYSARANLLPAIIAQD